MHTIVDPYESVIMRQSYQDLDSLPLQKRWMYTHHCRSICVCHYAAVLSRSRLFAFAKAVGGTHSVTDRIRNMLTVGDRTKLLRQNMYKKVLPASQE